MSTISLFLVVQPGQLLCSTSDGTLTRAQPLACLHNIEHKLPLEVVPHHSLHHSVHQSRSKTHDIQVFSYRSICSDRSREVFMLDASVLTLGAPATALPDAALAAAGLPSAQQMAADSLATDRALDPPSYSTEGAGAKTSLPA